MGRPKKLAPDLYWLTARSQWAITIAGKRSLLGADRKVAEARARVLVGRHLAGKPAAVALAAETVADVLALYREQIRPDMDSRHRRRIETAGDELVAFCGELPAEKFRARTLRQWRASLFGRDWSRTYINHLVAVVKTVWIWAAGEELISAECAFSLRLVRRLGEGEGGKETPRIGPVDPALVAATLPHLPPLVAALVQVQLACGLRPSEVCRMVRGELSTGPVELLDLGSGIRVAAHEAEGVLVWLYLFRKHKTSRKGQLRLVAVGPAAQTILRPLLVGLGPQDPIFSARAGRAYLLQSYSDAVRTACQKARLPFWQPRQLRKTAADAVANVAGPDVAGDVLGHSDLATTLRHYLTVHLARAVAYAAQHG